MSIIADLMEAGELAACDGEILGIYQIRNAVNGKVYVGQSRDVRRRWKRHQATITARKHENIHLQRAWDKYGGEAFVFEVLEIVDDENALTDKEQCWIDRCQASDDNYGYNLRPAAGTMLGYHHTKETKKKISAAFKGKALTKEHKEKIGRSLVGHTLSAASREKITKKLMGRHLSPEHRAKLSMVLTGRPVTPETREKISKAHRGKGGKLSQEQVTSIRTRYILGDTAADLALEHGVSMATAQEIIRNKTWRDPAWGDTITAYRKKHPRSLVTASTREKMSKGHRGANSHRAKLTWGLVRQIRAEYVPQRVSQSMLGEKYGVEQSTIGCIVRNESWVVE